MVAPRSVGSAEPYWPVSHPHAELGLLGVWLGLGAGLRHLPSHSGDERAAVLPGALHDMTGQAGVLLA